MHLEKQIGKQPLQRKHYHAMHLPRMVSIVKVSMPLCVCVDREYKYMCV